MDISTHRTHHPAVKVKQKSKLSTKMMLRTTACGPHDRSNQGHTRKTMAKEVMG
jgi:hypothetical protein